MSLYLQSVIIKKELGFETALKMAQEIIKNKKKTHYDIDRNDEFYVFRNIPKVLFDKNSLMYKQVNENVKLLFGNLKTK